MIRRFASWLVHEAGVVSKLVAFVAVAAVAGLLTAGLVMPFAGAAGLGVKQTTDQFEALPSQLTTTPNKVRSTMVDGEGNTIATFFDENRIDLASDEIAPVMKQAIVAIEDSRFYQHGAIDLRGTLRALVRNQQAGGVSQGGSTITQQYVKLTLLEGARSTADRKAAIEDTYGRKIQELRYAIAIEDSLSKDEILRRYLNIAYFGDGAYGVEAAARHYFGINARKLSLPQAAMLAGMVRDPNGLDPVNDPTAAKDRRDFVLNRMYVNKAISWKDMHAAQGTGLGLNVTKTANGCFVSPYPFYCQYVLENLLDDKAFGATRELRRQFVYTNGLTIKTALVPKMQDAAQKSVADHVRPHDSAIGVLSVIKPGTGMVTAMAQSRPMGSKDGQTFVNYNVDAAHGGPAYGMQPGSAMKTFVLAAALEQGIPLMARFDAPPVVDLNGPFKTCHGTVRDDWTVRNLHKSGTFSLITGLTHSVNTFFAQLEERTGICDPARIAADLGLKRGDGHPLQQVKSFTLGVNEITPLSLAAAYAAFAARGVACTPTVVTGVVDRKGNSLEVPGAACHQAMPAKVADAVAYALHQNLDGSTDPGRGARKLVLPGHEAGGKTGTNDANRALTFAGVTPDLAAVSMVADVDPPITSLRGKTINGVVIEGNAAFGSTLAGPIWKQAMIDILGNTPGTPFPAVEPKLLDGKPVNVPYVIGYTVDSAKVLLELAGFEVQIGTPVDSTDPQGTIVEQSPRGMAGQGALITITPSAGAPFTLQVPGTQNGTGNGTGTGNGNGNGNTGTGTGNGNGNGNTGTGTGNGNNGNGNGNTGTGNTGNRNGNGNGNNGNN